MKELGGMSVCGAVVVVGLSDSCGIGVGSNPDDLLLAPKVLLEPATLGLEGSSPMVS